MIGALALIAITSIRGGQAADPDVRGLLQRWRSQCAAAPGGAACVQLRIQLERALFRDLNRLYLAGERLDRAVLQVAARAGTPELAAFGLRRLADAPGPEDAAAAREGLDSPFPAVRAAAAELARGSEQPALRMLAGRVARSARIKGTGLVAEEPPAGKALGAAPYPGARFRFAASQPGMAVFTTADAVDKVLAHYGRDRRVLSAADFKAQRKARPSKDEEQAMAQRMMAELMKGRDPQQVAQEMGRSEQARQTDWAKGIDGEAGISSARYVVLAEAGGTPTRVLAVYRDEAFGATALAFRSVPEAPGQAPVRTRQDAELSSALMELLQRTD